MIESILFILLAAGIIVLKFRDLQLLVYAFGKRISSLKKGFINDEEWQTGRKERFQERVPEHVRRLLQLAFSMGTKKSVRTFFILSLFLGGSVFFLFLGKTSILTASAAAFLGTLIPYLGLRVLVQGRQVTGSHEGEILVTEILNNYKIHYCNMTRAIEATAMTLEGAPYSRRLLFNLSRGLNKVSGTAELKVLLEEFRFGMGTSWAGILSTNIYLACSSGIRVTRSLSDLARSMEQARQIEEFSQRENNEARAILYYLVPFGSLFMTAAGIHFFGLTAEDWFYYQFQTTGGITWFVLWLLVYLSAVGVHLLLSNRKFDL